MTLTHMKKHSLKAAITLALGVAAIGPQMASAVTIDDGVYSMTIVSGKATTAVGTDGNWNSTFTFGCRLGATGCGSQNMTDNGTNVVYSTGLAAGTAFGSGVGADGVAGTIKMTIVGGVITSVSSFNVDLIKSTAGGDFAQYANSLTGMGGSISASGAMTFDPTGRLGAVSGYDTLYNKPWNQQPLATAYNTFTTGAATATGCVGSTTANPGCTVNGAAISGSAGNYTGVLVSAGNVGTNWGGFAGNPYFETWKIKLTKTSSLAAPVPAAAWLFGSGLVGLVGVARRKKA